MPFCYDSNKLHPVAQERKACALPNQDGSGCKKWPDDFPASRWPQAKGLACYSLGIVLADTCGLTQGADRLAELLGPQCDAYKQRLRQWCHEAAAKRGKPKGDQVVVAACFVPLLAWIIALWDKTSRHLVLVLGATRVADGFVGLSISVVLGSCAIAMAWSIRHAKGKAAHNRPWLALLDQLAGAVPPDWQVLVMADRSLYTKWLYKRIVHPGGIPSCASLSVGKHARSRPPAGGCSSRSWAWSRAAARKGVDGCAVFRRREPGSALRCWRVGMQAQATAGSRLCDLAVEQAEGCWYGRRSWMECGLKDGKRGGWNWQGCRCQNPQRVERLWLAMAAATLMAVGGGAQRSQV